MREYVQQRLRKSSRAIEAARILERERLFDSAADRAYYAMFYAAEALLAEQDLEFSSHGAVHGAFGKEFAKSGALDPKYHQWLLGAFESRQSATYGTDLGQEIDERDVQELIA